MEEMVLVVVVNQAMVVMEEHKLLVDKEVSTQDTMLAMMAY